MRNRIGLGIMGLALLTGLRTANAQDTPTLDWVQNANYALTAQVQTGDGTVQSFAINSKTIIQYLRGVSFTNTTDIISIATNAPLAGINVTNAAFLPNAGAPTNTLPATFSITNFTLTSGTNHYTNHVQFSNDVNFNLQADQGSYLLDTNIIVLDTNTPGITNPIAFSIITNLNFTNVSLAPLASSPQILAVFNTNSVDTNGVGSNTIFTLYGVTVTTTTTNVGTTSVPMTFVSKNPKLIVKSSADNDSFTFWIRDGTPQAPIDYDVTQFFNFNHLNTVTALKGSSEIDYLDLSVDFNNNEGTGFGTEANGKETRGPVHGQTGLFVKSVTATCAGSGQASEPPTGNPPTGKPFPVGNMIVGGRVSITGGKLETPRTQ